MNSRPVLHDSAVRPDSKTTLRKSFIQLTGNLPRGSIFSRRSSRANSPLTPSTLQASNKRADGDYKHQHEWSEWTASRPEESMEYHRRYHDRDSGYGKGTTQYTKHNSFADARSCSREFNNGCGRSRSPLAHPSGTSCFLVIGDPVKRPVSSVDLKSSGGPIVTQLHQSAAARPSISSSSPFKGQQGSPAAGPKPLEKLITMQRRPTVNGSKSSSARHERAIENEQSSEFVRKSKSTGVLANSQAQGFASGYNCHEGSVSDNSNYTWAPDSQSDHQSRCNANMFFQPRTNNGQRQPQFREEQIERRSFVDAGKKLPYFNTMPDKKNVLPVELPRRQTTSVPSSKPSPKSWEEKLQEETARGNGMRIKDLKQKLSLMGVSTESFTEKSELAEAYAQAVLKAEIEAALPTQREPQPYSWAPPTTAVLANNSSTQSHSQKSVGSWDKFDDTSSPKRSAHGSEQNRFSNGPVLRSSHSHETYRTSNKSYQDDLRSTSLHSQRRQAVDVGHLPRRPSGSRIPEVLSLIAISSERGKNDKCGLPRKTDAFESVKIPSRDVLLEASHKMRKISNQISGHPVSSKILELAKILDEVVDEVHSLDLSSDAEKEEVTRDPAYQPELCCNQIMPP